MTHDGAAQARLRRCAAASDRFGEGVARRLPGEPVYGRAEGSVGLALPVGRFDVVDPGAVGVDEASREGDVELDRLGMDAQGAACRSAPVVWQADLTTVLARKPREQMASNRGSARRMSNQRPV